MARIRLVQILENAPPSLPLSVEARHAVQLAKNRYATGGAEAPWYTYLVTFGEELVGHCGFISAPIDKKVELDVVTFPTFQKRGFGLQMVEALVNLARRAHTGIEITARASQDNIAASRLLSKAGFRAMGESSRDGGGTTQTWALPFVTPTSRG